MGKNLDIHTSSSSFDGVLLGFVFFLLLSLLVGIQLIVLRDAACL